MAEISYPFDTQTVSEDQWSQMMRNVAPSGVYFGTGADLASTAGTGLEVILGSGAAMVRGFYYGSDTSINLALAPNSSGMTRIDRVVLRLDPTANSVTAAVLQGTPAASPIAPALTQTDAGIYEEGLCQVPVVDGAGAPGSFTDTRQVPLTVGEPIGTVTAFAGASAPLGWLLCDGSSVRVDAQSRLFDAIGYQYGGGGTDFSLPDLKGRVPGGIDGAQSEFNTLGKKGGAKTHTLTTAQTPTHSHGMAHGHTASSGTTGNHTHTQGGYVSTSVDTSAGGLGNDWQILNTSKPLSTGATGNHSHSVTVNNTSTTSTGNSGSNNSHNILQPCLALNYIIRAY